MARFWEDMACWLWIESLLDYEWKQYLCQYIKEIVLLKLISILVYKRNSRMKPIPMSVYKRNSKLKLIAMSVYKRNNNQTTAGTNNNSWLVKVMARLWGDMARQLWIESLLDYELDRYPCRYRKEMGSEFKPIPMLVYKRNSINDV